MNTLKLKQKVNKVKKHTKYNVFFDKVDGLWYATDVNYPDIMGAGITRKEAVDEYRLAIKYFNEQYRELYKKVNGIVKEYCRVKGL